MGFLLLVPNSSWAECADVEAAISSAEQDLVSFYLSDAQHSLEEAIEGIGCGSAPVAPVQLSRYWQAQAMVWAFQDESDPRIDEAWAASKLGDPTHFNEDYGDKARQAWEAAKPEVEHFSELSLRGAEEGAKVWVDGQLIDGLQVPLGFHILQVGTESPSFARALHIQGESLTVALPAAESTSEPPKETKVIEGPPPPPKVEHPPLRFVGNQVYDREDKRVRFREIRSVLRSYPEGKLLLNGRRNNLIAQGAALSVAAGTGYATYLFVWDLTDGHNLESSISTSLVSTSLLVGALALAVERNLMVQRKKDKRKLVEAAAERWEQR